MFEQRYARKLKSITGASIIALFGFATAPASAADCNRACMTDMIGLYADALVAHDPSMLPLADKVKFTEDSKALELGEGLWKTVTSKHGFRHDYLDTAKQIAASHIVFHEGENQILLSVLLHLTDMKVSGIETLVQRITPESRFQPRELGGPIKGMNDPIPKGKKMSRAAMVKTALTYTEGLRVGSFTDGGTPFAPETYRVENGWITASGDVMYTQNITVHPSILGKAAVVDEENGVVVLWMNFGHAGDSYGVGNSLVTFEAFKVWGGEIHSINAFFTGLPIATARFWPASDPAPK